MSKTLLFVDDEDMNLFILDKLFSKEYEVMTANSAAEGLEIIRQEIAQIDVVITDLKMPEMSGMEMINQAGDLLQGTPAFLLTGYNHHQEIDDAIANNTITGVFKKPFDFEQMRKELADLFSKD